MVIETIKLDFVGSEKELKAIFKILADHEDEQVFNNRTINAFIERVWQLHYPKIIRWICLPYLVFFVFFNLYLILVFKVEKRARPGFFSPNMNMTSGEEMVTWQLEETDEKYVYRHVVFSWL